MNTPVDILRVANGSGIRIALAQSGNLYVEPIAALTPELRALLVEHKPEVIAFLHEAQNTAVLLVQAAMRACDHWGDGPEARAAMRDDVLATPSQQMADLLEHFRDQYGEATSEPANELVAATQAPRSCASCVHRTKAGSCGEPVAARLAVKFEVVWPPAGYGVTCPAFHARGEDINRVFDSCSRGHAGDAA